MARKKQGIVRRLLNHVLFARNGTDCWLWQGALSREGMPMIRNDGPGINSAKKVALEHYGRKWVPPGTNGRLEIIMTCGNRYCVNHRHMLRKWSNIDDIMGLSDEELEKAKQVVAELPTQKDLAAVIARRNAYQREYYQYHSRCRAIVGTGECGHRLVKGTLEYKRALCADHADYPLKLNEWQFADGQLAWYDAQLARKWPHRDIPTLKSRGEGEKR